MGKFDLNVDLSLTNSRGISVVKCGCKIDKGSFLAANKEGLAVLSQSRFDVIGVALESGEKNDMIRMQLY